MADAENVTIYSFPAFDKPNNFKTKKVWIGSWRWRTGDLVQKGDELADIEIRGKNKNGEEAFAAISVIANSNGYLEILKAIGSESDNLISDGENIFIIHPQLTQELKEKKCSNVSDIKIDVFSGVKEIRWKSVGGRTKMRRFEDKISDCFLLLSTENHYKLFFTLHNSENKDYIVLRYSTQDFKLNVTDKLSFLFSNGDLLKFDIIQKPYKYSINPNWGHIFETRMQLTTQELFLLKNQGISNWQIEFSMSDKKITGLMDEDLQFSIKKFVSEYCELVQLEIENYQPLLTKQEQKLGITMNDESCHVYLMVDTNNNYQKIGISNKPEWREHTLQSEKPTIELIVSKKFVNRKIASAIEQALHATYANKRIRGEWFQLDAKEVEEIKQTLAT